MERNALGRNVGWQVWNMSKRVSRVRALARDSRTHLERARRAGRWDADYLAALEGFTERLEAIAERADGVWAELTAAARTGKPELIDEGRSVTVVRSGENDDRLERVEAIWHAGRVSADYHQVQEEYSAAARAVGDRVPWW